MKKKNDFVTNSSSTSFVAWGINLTEEAIFSNEKLIVKVIDKLSKKNYEGITSIKDLKNNIDDVMEVICYDLITKENILSATRGPDYDENEIIIGGAVKKIQDNQTLFEFKQQIIEALKNIGIETNKVYYIEECWKDV